MLCGDYIACVYALAVEVLVGVFGFFVLWLGLLIVLIDLILGLCLLGCSD